jgi:hypothetical protein
MLLLVAVELVAMVHHLVFQALVLLMLEVVVVLEIVEPLEVVLVVQVAEVLVMLLLQVQTEQPILVEAVAVVALVLISVDLVAQELSSSLTQAHNNLVAVQLHQVVATLSIHSLLVVY